MHHKLFLHVTLLALAVMVVYLWVTDPNLSLFSLQLTALLMLVLVITRFLIKPASFRLVESIISTMAVLLVINDTGNLSSPLFFLNFFLLFELSLLLEPVIPLILSAILILFYIVLNIPIVNVSSFTILLAFPFMTPLAVFLGKIYSKEENQKREIRNLSSKIKALEGNS